MAEQLIDDTQGNVLGERETFLYTSDNGRQYNMDLDNSLSLPVGNSPSTDASLDAVNATATRPFKPRYINVVASNDDNIRKQIVVCSATNPLFVGTASTFTANGVEFTVLSSVGERRSRLRTLSAPAV